MERRSNSLFIFEIKKIMETVNVEGFYIIGIAVRTTNENGQSAKDIGALWNKFISEGIVDKIPNKVNTEIYSVYTDYEGDYMQPYTTILGCKVENLDNIPEGMVAKEIKGWKYAKFIAKGDLTKGAIYQEWSKIWNTDLERVYTSDFEIYGEKAQNPIDAEVEILVAIT